MEIPDSAPVLRWTLDDTMKQYNVSRRSLQQETGISINTIRSICNGKPTRIDVVVIQKLVCGLRILTNLEIGVDDVIKWV